jgi:hypothetical protein
MFSSFELQIERIADAEPCLFRQQLLKLTMIKNLPPLKTSQIKKMQNLSLTKKTAVNALVLKVRFSNN